MLPENPEYVFITEGEFDTMSIDQSCFPSVSVSGSKISKEMQEEFKNLSHDIKFIVLLDNDETGNRMADENADILIKLGFWAMTAKLDENYKDANEFLQKNPDGLQKNLENIIQLAKNYVLVPKQNPQKSASKTTKNAIFNCPIDLKIPDGYLFNQNGIFKKTKDGQKNISNTPMVITRTFATSKGENSHVEISILNPKTKTWKTHIVPRNTLDSKNLSSLIFDDMINDPQNVEVIPAVELITKPGWTDDTFTKFIIPPGDGKTFLVRNNGIDYERAFVSKGDKNIWLEIFKETFSKSWLAREVVGYVLAAPLLEVCKVKNIQVVPIAPSGSGKSAIAKFAFSIMGNPEFLRRTFNGTDNALEYLGICFNSMAVWIDEFQSAKKSLKENIESVVYNLAEGKTRSRMTRVYCRTKFFEKRQQSRLFGSSSRTQRQRCH